MSSAMELLNNKGTFLEQKRLFRTSKKVTYRSSWRDQSPKRSSSRPRSSSKKMIQVRIKKMDKSKTHIKDKLIKKKTEHQKLPEAPHNTTQFIIDVNNHHTCAETPNIYGEDHDQFQFSFAHHPMAGSMMSMMSRLSEPSSFSHNGLGFFGEKFTTDNTDVSSNCEENNIQEDNRLVNSISSEQETDLGQGGNECGDYSQYLRQCEAGGDLQETVRNLVELLKQKDQQIEDMKSIYN